jgi:hypothetical protein
LEQGSQRRESSPLYYCDGKTIHSRTKSEKHCNTKANSDYIAALNQAAHTNQISPDNSEWLEYERMRQLLPATVLLIASMTENEALDLAQDIVRNVATRRKPRLEIVK